MSNVSFFEYSYNPAYENSKEVAQRLCDLGFICRAKHQHSDYTIWVQNLCILLVRDVEDHPGAGRITGMGLNVDHQTLINQHEASPDPATDFFKLTVNDFNIYMVEESVLTEKSLINYEVVRDTVNHYNKGLEYFSGLEINLSDPGALYLKLTQLGFKEDSGRLLSKNNRFTLMLRESGAINPTLIVDTQDVFGTTARYTLADVELLEFDTMPEEDFKDLTHKIKGYNCVAFGNYNSHSIENYIPSRVVNFNVVFRQRKQYLKIHEDTLDFYGTRTET